MRGAWREGVVEGEDIVVGRGLALGWGGAGRCRFRCGSGRCVYSNNTGKVGRKISMSFLFLAFPSLVHDSVVSVGRYLRR